MNHKTQLLLHSVPTYLHTNLPLQIEKRNWQLVLYNNEYYVNNLNYLAGISVCFVVQICATFVYSKTIYLHNTLRINHGLTF